VLLLDEPFSALDAFTRVELEEHLAEIWQETRPTLVLVTHDIEEAVALGSRVVVLRSSPGRLAASFEIGLTRPRNRLSSLFDDEKRRVLQALNLTLARDSRSDLVPKTAAAK
jgi:sulfonate transport system ATP-binding protein